MNCSWRLSLIVIISFLISTDQEAAEIMGIKILDHIIIGDGKYASFAERCLM